MSEKRVNNISIEGARILFRNLAGKPDKFNPKGGKRTFSIFLEEDVATKLMEDGWNVKPLQSRDPEDPPRYHLPVEAKFGDYPPNIFLIVGNHKTKLDEDTVGSLDYAEIQNVDIIVQPYTWSVRDKAGIKAYVKNMYVTIVENEFEKKYRNYDEGESEEDLPF